MLKIICCQLLLFGCLMEPDAQKTEQLKSLERLSFVRSTISSVIKRESERRYDVPEVNNKNDYSAFGKSQSNEYSEKLDSFVTYQWHDNDETSTPRSKLRFIYDDHGNTAGRIESEWDESADKWLYVKRTDYRYDETGRIIHTTIWFWETDDWKYQTKTDFTYEDALQTKTESVFDAIANEWVKSSLEETIIFSDSSYSLSYEWDPVISDWSIHYFSKTFLDSTGNISWDINFRWITSSETWLPQVAHTYSYNDQGNKVHYEILYYSGVNRWTVYNYCDLFYDGRGNEIKHCYYKFNGDRKYILEFIKESIYDENGNEVKIIRSTWDSEDEIYRHELLIQNFDMNAYANEIILPLNYYGPFVLYQTRAYQFAPCKNKPLSVYQFIVNDPDTIWNLNSSGICFYSVISEPNNVDNYSVSNFIIFPNPVTDHINVVSLVSTGNYFLKLFDLTGRLLFSMPFNNSTQINTGEIMSGIYILTISTEQKNVHSEKIIKQ